MEEKRIEENGIIYGLFKAVERRICFNNMFKQALYRIAKKCSYIIKNK